MSVDGDSSFSKKDMLSKRLCEVDRLDRRVAAAAGLYCPRPIKAVDNSL